ncbi:DUF3570 domain-containing protein [Rivibacter subsaxonicus]|uniref:Uncharacterized protein DUF3570 n=1 Tax=Rivibacter subsaxonicus TaxID=457575 RepID=A0A4Q7W1L3_9BURK|nr:DUF3570 domain-containing protein [Rivibacter subsaxonicus]RZU02798.1 uncharacterized protein DUF3570 [Rivibacter subsaxonicus]
MAATKHWLARLLALLAAPLGGLLAAGGTRAAELPEDRGDAMFHLYDGGGVRASGPALLVRKSIADKVSLSAGYYVDMVSNASIDVVTTASPFKETRNAVDLGAVYAVRDSLLTLSLARSTEPDYVASSASLDMSQEVFGGMTTIALGFTRGSDEVSKTGSPEFADYAKHWQYRLGVTQILTPRWLMSLNFEAVSDDGFLGSPYRVARAFGAIVPERNPRTRSSRAIKLRSVTAVGEQGAVRAEYRYFWDTWDIGAHTLEAGYARHIGERWIADAHARYYTQSKALFYSDNATTDTLYLSRNRQLGTFTNTGLGAKLAYTFAGAPGKYELKASGSYELLRFDYADFTDLRTGKPYAFNAHVLQLLVTAIF